MTDPTIEQFRMNSPLGVASRILAHRLSGLSRNVESQTHYDMLLEELVAALYDYGDAIAKRSAQYTQIGF